MKCNFGCVIVYHGCVDEIDAYQSQRTTNPLNLLKAWHSAGANIKWKANTHNYKKYLYAAQEVPAGFRSHET